MSANQPPRSVNFPSLLVSEDDEAGGALSGEADNETSVHSWINADFVPSWLKPFTIDENTRFTRTPDHLLRPPEEPAPREGFLIGGTGWHFLEMPLDAEEEAPAGSNLQADLEALETAFSDLRTHQPQEEARPPADEALAGHGQAWTEEAAFTVAPEDDWGAEPAAAMPSSPVDAAPHEAWLEDFAPTSFPPERGDVVADVAAAEDIPAPVNDGPELMAEERASDLRITGDFVPEDFAPEDPAIEEMAGAEPAAEAGAVVGTVHWEPDADAVSAESALEAVPTGMRDEAVFLSSDPELVAPGADGTDEAVAGEVMTASSSCAQSSPSEAGADEAADSLVPAHLQVLKRVFILGEADFAWPGVEDQDLQPSPEGAPLDGGEAGASDAVADLAAVREEIPVAGSDGPEDHDPLAPPATALGSAIPTVEGEVVDGPAAVLEAEAPAEEACIVAAAAPETDWDETAPEEDAAPVADVLAVPGPSDEAAPVSGEEPAVGDVFAEEELAEEEFAAEERAEEALLAAEVEPRESQDAPEGASEIDDDEDEDACGDFDADDFCDEDDDFDDDLDDEGVLDDLDERDAFAGVAAEDASVEVMEPDLQEAEAPTAAAPEAGLQPAIGEEAEKAGVEENEAAALSTEAPHEAPTPGLAAAADPVEAPCAPAPLAAAACAQPVAPAVAPSVGGSFYWQSYHQTIRPDLMSFLGTAVVAPQAPAPASADARAVEAVPAALTPEVCAGGAPEMTPREEAGVSPATGHDLPDLALLSEPPELEPDYELSEEFLDQNSAALQQILRDFGIRGEVIDANPGPVVTLYEFEPAPGVKSSRVIGLADDIARSMSAISARVAVVPGRNVIGIELPNRRRDTVWLRELLASHESAETRTKLGICLGKTIGGEPVIADLARMPHLLVAGTTGSGKSVAINAMILSLLYQHTPDACRLIMVDPKMLELSIYEGIPHLLTPVVTDPKKAIIALKWAVKEMEDRYRKMARLAVRNIDGYNARMAEARAKGEIITRQVQVGFDKESGEALFEEQEMDLSPLPYIVVVVDEMADLMMVAGKEIEGAIQRLAQMARAAGIHLIMATQRPSVDVITGTIKANFPTRISFQVTSKIDSRTILGEMGAETLLGQGDMLFMAGGGRITRVHGPFVSDAEVEHVVAFLKAQGGPEYLDDVLLDEEADGPADSDDAAVFDKGALGETSGDLYEQAVAIVMRDRKASTSYIQRRLQVGYNKAASLMERMESEGIVGPANHAGKREILTFSRPD